MVELGHPPGKFAHFIWLDLLKFEGAHYRPFELEEGRRRFYADATGPAEVRMIVTKSEGGEIRFLCKASAEFCVKCETQSKTSGRQRDRKRYRSRAERVPDVPVQSSEKPFVPRKRTDQRRDVKLAAILDQILPQFQKGIETLRSAQKSWPTDRRRWESALRQQGFTDQVDLDAMMSSTSATAAAAKSLATKQKISPRTVQNACYKFKPSN